MVEMLARVSKKILRRSWRKFTRQCQSEPPVEFTDMPREQRVSIIKTEMDRITIDFFNIILGTSKQSAHVNSIDRQSLTSF